MTLADPKGNEFCVVRSEAERAAEAEAEIARSIEVVPTPCHP